MNWARTENIIHNKLHMSFDVLSHNNVEASVTNSALPP